MSYQPQIKKIKYGDQNDPCKKGKKGKTQKVKIKREHGKV
jgi:hypothetical protein